MKRRTKRAIESAQKREQRMSNPGGNSRYARKKRWLDAENRRRAYTDPPLPGVMGCDIPHPKPWA